MLRRFIPAVILLMLIFFGCNTAPKHTNASEEIIALERSALDKWAHSNTMGYIDISADDVTWFDFTGDEQLVEGRNAVKKFLSPLSGQIPLHNYEIVNPKVQVYENCAILTFHWKAVTNDSKPLPGWKATSVYYWKDGKWQQVHANWSELQGT